MADRDFTLAQFVSSRLSEVADPKKAVAMAAYMKTNQPFYGVPNPGRLLIFKEIKQRPSPVNHKAYEREVRSLWRLPHREERYLAIAYARLYPQFIAPESIRLYERMVRDGAWWDFVDEIAVHLMGQVLLKHREVTRPIIEQWIDDDDMWIRRTAILVHCRHKAQTDSAQLFDHCLRRGGEKEFFIRKAIGWALREYAKTKPAEVLTFIKKHRALLSPLSYSEASRHLADYAR